MSEAAVEVTTSPIKPIPTRPAFLTPKVVLLLAFGFVVVCRILAAAFLPARTGAFELLYASAARLLGGESLYPFGNQWLPYPLPAVLLVIPFTAFPLAIARPLFDVMIGWAFVYALWKF